VNETAVKFGYPQSLLADFEHWCVLLRPAQVTVGSLVLLCKDPARHFGEISPEASAELVHVVAGIESALGAAFRHDKINYLMLMMVDPDVHFHVIPRYASEREVAGRTFQDPFWPGPPDVTRRLDADESVMAAIGDALRAQLAEVTG
jgi:diadenosine tetraphosphate (Ap4A) HIT family hydrolase